LLRIGIRFALDNQILGSRHSTPIIRHSTRNILVARIPIVILTHISNRAVQQNIIIFKMKSNFYFLTILFSCLLLISSCSRDKETQQQIAAPQNFSSSPKGWELYSWYDGTQWNYSLLMGTNRLKTCDEVLQNKETAMGELDLMKLLERLPQGEEILWIGQDWMKRCGAMGNCTHLQLPPQSIIDDMLLYCYSIRLKLNVAA
jgi:hypothetical protein